MLFNSLHFAIFLPIVFVLYWFVTQRNLRVQNLLLLVASYYFYACWDVRFLSLLMFSTLLDFFTGWKIDQSSNPKHKKIWLWLSIAINLGLLGVFKYYNFFVESFADFMTAFGLEVHPKTLHIILPIGISFYTFHGLSYVIDIYKKKISAEKNLIDYGVFVSFFPLLVAGPIERATHLLPQIKKIRIFDESKAIDGLKQMLWGFVKKIVIADNCAVIVNDIFGNPAEHSTLALIVGAILFSLQLYGDFSGYSDIAIGTAKLFGIDLLKNFAFPYFSRNIPEYRRRWHISLTSWFRDYVYIPLGGNKKGRWIQLRNVFFIFFLSGLWHGAEWTFVVWGLINAAFFIPEILTKNKKPRTPIVAQGKLFPSVKEVLQMSGTFGLIVFVSIFFRAENMTHAKVFLNSIFHSDQLVSDAVFTPKLFMLFVLIFCFIAVEWSGREREYALENFAVHQGRIFRWSAYLFMVYLIITQIKTIATPFIYFQF